MITIDYIGLIFLVGVALILGILGVRFLNGWFPGISMVQIQPKNIKKVLFLGIFLIILSLALFFPKIKKEREGRGPQLGITSEIPSTLIWERNNPNCVIIPDQKYKRDYKRFNSKDEARRYAEKFIEMNPQTWVRAIVKMVGNEFVVICENTDTVR